MISNGLFSFILVTILGLPGLAETKTPPAEVTDIFYVCKNDKATRWLRAYKLENGKCHTIYSKEGYLQVISSATYYTMCEGVLHNVRKNIEEGGYKCSKVENYSFLEIE